MMSGGKIKEVQVSLLLSSRAEMQKVIEEARRTTMSFMQLSAQSVAAAPSPPAVAPVMPKVATVVPTTVATQQPQPPVISLSGFLAQNLNQQKVAAGTASLYSEIPGLGFLAAGGGMFQPNAPAAGLFSALSSQPYGGAAAGAGANSAFTQLSEQLKKAAEAEKAAAAKSAAAVVQSSADARSGKVNPWDTPIQQNLLKLASSSVAKSTSVPPSIRSPIAGGFNPGPGEFSQPGYQGKPVVQQVNYGSFEASKPISNEHLSKLQELHSRRDPRMFQNPPQQHQSNSNGGYGKQDPSGYGNYGNDNIANNIASRLLPNKPNNYNSGGDVGGPPNQQHYRQQSSIYDDEMDGQSIKISNLETATGYGEIRRFFSGQAISSNGIKMINDPNGKRTGVAYVRFLRKDAKRYAMSRNGQNMRRSAVKVESISDREFDDAIDSYQPGFDERKPYWVESYGGRNEKKNERGEDAGVIEIGDESLNDRDNGKCGHLMVWNLPTGTTELDLMRIFSDFTIVEVLIIKNYKNPKQQDGYVKFCRLQDARRACESTHQHFIRSKRVFVKPCSDIEYDAAKNEYDAPETIEEPKLESEPAKEDPLDDSVQVVEDSIDSKKDEDDRMDLAEDDDDEEEGQEEVVQNKIPLDEEVRPEDADDDPPLDDLKPVQTGKTEDEDQCWEVDDQSQSPKQQAQQQQQAQQPPPVNFVNRDPRNAFSTNLYQSPPSFQQQQLQPQQQQPPPQQSPQFAGPPPNFNSNSSNNNNNFGGDFSRDPRRRQEINQRNEGGGGFQQSENSRESFDSRHSFNNGPRFNSQGPPPQQGPPMHQQNRYDQQMPDGNERTAFVLISNLEFSMREETVQTFLDREGFTPKKLQIIRNAFNGRSSGECLVEFESVQEAGDSLIKNAAVIGNRKAFFKHLVRGQLPEMMMRINSGNQRGPPQGGYGGNGRYGGNGNFGGNGHFGGNGNFGNNNFRGGNDRFNNNNNGGGNSYASQVNNSQFADDEPHERRHDDDNQQNFDDQSDVQIVANENAPSANNGGQGEHDDDDDVAVVIHDDPDDHADPPEQVNSAESLRSQKGAPSNSSQQSLGGGPGEMRTNPCLNDHPVPGSILSMGNLPFRARNEDIVDFFKQYNITLDDVKRRYLPDGRSTGDAMVRFQSPQDAHRALETHQQMRIGGRELRMWISD
ncbi:heterogeneous nuclear ribonucleoprotein [Culex quinquefasciatus]|uniref:Heterogeneous nuclear ribonucleoprotein n=1 Tax=Culex quinquefasciatus TaxID=7176 RepID=B0X478_CULQU|nr:heterogeneous nuclear ribonucleoprotein [Culex quinquefasciatus]|eukprot:XP_001864450.1 heterogeneous nuclear ribonucleoprotein [Culex quinquefasciatus]